MALAILYGKIPHGTKSCLARRYHINEQTLTAEQLTNFPLLGIKEFLSLGIASGIGAVAGTGT